MNKYYDQVHACKDYNQDISFITSYLEKSFYNKFSRIFEIGCGTGNHTLLLARLFKSVSAFDIDHNMIEKLKSKLKEQQINNVSVDILPLSAHQWNNLNGTFSVGCSFFNVLNYVLKFEELVTFFKTASDFLTINGLFFFDCYKENMFQEEKIVKENIYKGEEFNFIRSIQTTYDTISKFVTVNSQITDHITNEKLQFTHIYKVWDSQAIKEALEAANFKIQFHEKKQKPYFQDESSTQDMYCVIRKEPA